MGFSSSLQRCLDADFSERVLLLHGLSSWSSPNGSFVVCEVDLSADGDTIGGEKEVQFVVEAIHWTNFGHSHSSVRKPRWVGDTIQGGQNPSCGINDNINSELQSLQFADGPHKVDVKQQLGHGIGRTADLVSDSYPQRFCSTSKLVQAREDAYVSKEEVQSVLTALATLAPDIRIRPASYDALVPIIRELQGKAMDSEIMHKGIRMKDLNPSSPEILSEAGHSVDDNRETNNGSGSFHRRARHPNLSPILGVLEGESCIYVVYALMPFTVQSLLYFSPAALGDDQHTRFLIFQLLSAVAYSHKRGLTHGNLLPSSILLTENLWCLITGYLQSPQRQQNKFAILHSASSCLADSDRDSALPRSKCNPEYSIAGFCSDWRGVIKRWWAGEVSNYDYLLLLNKLSGRRWADPCFHSVMPWVIDFSVKPDLQSNTGWRDLSKSKWRLAKGDEQLDFTYASAEMPHHVSDECLSELAVCIYKARRLPLLVLRRIVRSVYEPNEYPVNMHRLYQWTPDECIPEFYSDSHIFESIHPGMNNLAVPNWAKDAVDFTSLHRAALESTRVSSELHHWIDLTFGYKLSGEAAVSAKNVTLSTVGPTVPRSTGRRQLFFQPHPQRQHCKTTDVLEKEGESVDGRVGSQQSKDQTTEWGRTHDVNAPSLHGTKRGLIKSRGLNVLHAAPFGFLEHLEEVSSFSESARHLSPSYNLTSECRDGVNVVRECNQENTNTDPQITRDLMKWRSSYNNVDAFISLLGDAGQYLKLVEGLHEEGDNWDDLYESLWASPKNVGHCKLLSAAESEDIFAIGCIIAELYLRTPLFDPTTASAYRAFGTLPDLIERLPPYVQCLVKSTLQREISRRPTASELLDSPFFSSTVRAVYFFLAPFQLLTNRHDQLQYLARMARRGAFISMGHSAAEMCAPSCLSLFVPPYPDIDIDAVVLVIKKLLQALKPHTCKELVVPAIQKLLQSQQSPSLKLALLQVSFVKELWSVVGTGAYLRSIHLSVLGSLRRSSSANHAKAAAKVLKSMCLDLGVPITLYQTVLPLLQAFGRDITLDHIDVLFGIGERIGEKLVVKHLLPPLRTIILSNSDILVTEGPGPVHSWRLLAMVDAMSVLERLRTILRPGVVLRELLQEPHNVYLKVLLQLKTSPIVLQCAARSLLLVCNHVGAEATVSFVLPQLKQLFDGLVFAGKLDGGSKNGKAFFKSSMRATFPNVQLNTNIEERLLSGSGENSQVFLPSGCRSGGNITVPLTEGTKVEDDIMLVLILYSGLASLLGIERLRQGLTTWLLLEQALLKQCNWKWKGSDVNLSKNLETPLSTEPSYESVNPANLLLDGVGWSSPLSQGSKWSRSPSYKRLSDVGYDKIKSVSEFEIGEVEEAWSWVNSNGTLWDAEAFGRIGAFGLSKDNQSWGLNSTILHSLRAHNGPIRSVAVSEDENMVFTAGGGPRGSSIVRQWRLATQECLMEYAGHDEIVNDVCILPGNEKMASCDGRIHIWSVHSGQRIALFDESSKSPSPSSSFSSGLSALNTNPGENNKSSIDLQNGNGPISNQSLTPNGLYSCLHSMEVEERLLAGMVNGSLRFIDINQGRQLYAWRLGQTETSLSSFVSAISSSGQGESMEGRKYSVRSSWVAVGFGSGLCRLMDYNSGAVVGQWRAHDGFITKLYALDEHYLVSSSQDKTISLWDLRRGSSPERLQVFRGHKRGVTSFSLRGCNLLSAAGSKIGLSCLSKTTNQDDEKHTVQPQKLYSAERGHRSLSSISAICVLPFSRLFIIGTDDGYLKICS